jgi:hypothetical protein
MPVIRVLILLWTRAAGCGGIKLTLEQKHTFVRYAMLVRGPEWVRNDLRVLPDAASVDHWSEGMVEKAFVAALTANR